MTDPSDPRAARQAILASGNPDLIGRLHLLDAAARPAAPSPWGTVAAMGAGVAGGAVLGTVLGGLVLDAQMRAAFAAVAAEAGFDPAAIDETLDGLASDPGDWDLGLGDLFDV